MNRTGRTAIRTGLLLAALALLRPEAAPARTLVEKTGDCEITVTVRIEIWGQPGQKIKSKTAAGQEIEIEGAASEATARAWKKQIEQVWNGLTEEQAREIAKRRGQQIPRRGTYDAELEKFRKETGEPAAMSLDCCRIRFVADVRARKGGPKDGTPGWHQIQAVAPQFEVEDRPGTPGVEKYRKKGRKKVWFRSWLRMPAKPGDSGSGAWSHDTKWPAWAHEVGHLMGLEDQHADMVKDWKTVSVPLEGHEHDLMADGFFGYPQGSAVRKLLKSLGAECNCCRDGVVDLAFQRFGRTAVVADDAVQTCNRRVLEQTLADFQDQMKNIRLTPMPLAKKFELWKRIREKIERIRRALRDCPKDEVALPGDPYRVSDDSAKWCTYSEGEGREVPGGPVIFVPDGWTRPGPPKEGGPGVPPAPPEKEKRPPGGLVVPPPEGLPAGEEGEKPPPEPEEKPPAPPKVTVFVKASRTGTGQALGGRRIKLIDPALVDPPLPELPGERKTLAQDAARSRRDFLAGEDPLQCVTGSDGTCEIGGVPVAPGTAPRDGRVETEVESEFTKSFIVPVVRAAGSGSPKVQPAARRRFRAGEKDYVQIDIVAKDATPEDFGTVYVPHLVMEVPKSWVENLCRDKEPAMPLEQAMRFRGGAARALPQARLRLRLEGSAP